MTHKLSDSLLAVEVPEGAYNLSFSFYGQPCLSYCFKNVNKRYGYEFGFIKLKALPYELIGIYPSEITEEIAKGLVKTKIFEGRKVYKNYRINKMYY